MIDDDSNMFGCLSILFDLRVSADPVGEKLKK